MNNRNRQIHDIERNILEALNSSTTTQQLEDTKKIRKPKPINYIDKKTFRLGKTHIDNLGKGAEFFKEDESSYVRRLLEIDPRKIKGLLNALESKEA